MACQQETLALQDTWSHLFWGLVFAIIVETIFPKLAVIFSTFSLVTPTDRPKSVRNRCVIKVFGGVFVLSCCLLDFSLGVGASVKELSQISFFFSLNITRYLLDFSSVCVI